MVNHLLFVFEGEVTEKGIVNSLTKFYLNENTVVQCAFCQDIYYLYEQISQDEDLDLFMLLKEKQVNKEILKNFNRNDFGEIYLFFDYDGHATKADDNKIKSLLQLFNNETEAGKLYISYPMVEAYKHLNPAISFETVSVQAKKISITSQSFTRNVHQNSDKMYQS